MRVRSCLVLGSTGLVGGQLLKLLLADENYRQVTALVRRPLELSHPRLTTLVCELDRPQSYADYLPVDDVFWAYQTLGVLPTATDREIHEAWRRKRRETHPDHAAGDAAEFERRSRLSRDLNRARDIIAAYRSGGARRAS